MRYFAVCTFSRSFVHKKHFGLLWQIFFKWDYPAKHLLVFKTSSRRLQDMSWRSLQLVFSLSIFRLPGHLEDVFNMSWKTKNSYAEVVFKTSWRHLLKTSWRHVLKTSSGRLGDIQNVYWGYLHLTNLNVYLTNLYFTNLYLTNLRQIQNALIRTQ